ncbi:MAG: hypothetical protein IPO21_06140, partial [Bacteroidales bacterium]|nr:hypothetical protein [Bacteroidales bacterium]
RYTSLVEDAKFKHGKKLALTVGIKSAKYETLLLTDADCFPASNQWLSKMVSNFVDKKEVVLGYGAYSPQKGLLDKIIRYDTLFIAMNYFSFAHAGLAYMGVGRNLAYKKSTFWKNKGFDSHYFLKSGDDDLFVNEVANKKNVALELSKESFTYSEQKASFKDWYFQKKRHSVTSKLYKLKHKLLLGMEPLTRSLLILLFIVYFVNNFTMHRHILLAALLFRMALQLLTVKLSMNKLNERNLLLYSPIIDFLLPIFYFLLLFTKKTVTTITGNGSKSESLRKSKA